MKKLLSLGLLAALFMVGPVLMKADAHTDRDAIELLKEESELVITEPGILPDSPFYFVKTAYENIHVFLTFDKEKRALLETKIANKKLAEAEKMAEKGKTEQAGKMIEMWQKRLDKLIANLERRREK